MSRRHGRAVMPWGKYKGVRIRLLPEPYLSWLTTTPMMRDPKWKWLLDSLVAELEFRGLNVEGMFSKDVAVPVQVEEENEPIRKFRD